MPTHSYDPVNFKRRTLIKLGTVGLVAAPVVSAGIYLRKASHQQAYFSAGADYKDNYFCAALDENGEQRFRLPIDLRAHSAAKCPATNNVVLFSRRPGNKAYLVDLHNSEMLSTVESEP